MPERRGSRRGLKLGDQVIFRGRRCYVRGFTSMGVTPTKVWIEDATTHQLRDADLDDVKSLPRAPGSSAEPD